MTDAKEFRKIVWSIDFDFSEDEEFYGLIDKLRVIANRMHPRVKARIMQEIDEEMENHVGGSIADSEYWSRLNAANSLLWFNGWQKFYR